MQTQNACPISSSNFRSIGRIAAILLCAAALACVPIEKASAWGIVGHRIVCEIAFLRLASDVQEEVNGLVGSFLKPNGKQFEDFRDSCAFADTARHNARDGLKRWRHFSDYDRWHYLNVPRSTANLFESKISCSSDCVLHAIAFHSEKIRDSDLPKAKRGEAIILLAHWIADIHQPLHVGFADDHGGSDIKIKSSARLGKNLHSAWDAGLLKHARGKRKLQAYISDLSKVRKSDAATWANKSNPLQWAAESYSLAISEGVGYCRWGNGLSGARKEKSCQAPADKVTLDKSYIAYNTPILERRLQQAAVRLATRLNVLLHYPQNERFNR